MIETDQTGLGKEPTVRAGPVDPIVDTGEAVAEYRRELHPVPDDLVDRRATAVRLHPMSVDHPPSPDRIGLRLAIGGGHRPQ